MVLEIFFIYSESFLRYWERELIFRFSFFLVSGKRFSCNVTLTFHRNKEEETRWKLKLVCTPLACRVDDFVGTTLDLVDIDPIESYARPLRSFESFLNASAKLTYIRSIAINDKGKKDTKYDRVCEFRCEIPTMLGTTWLDIHEDHAEKIMLANYQARNGSLSLVAHKQ